MELADKLKQLLNWQAFLLHIWHSKYVSLYSLFIFLIILQNKLKKANKAELFSFLNKQRWKFYVDEIIYGILDITYDAYSCNIPNRFHISDLQIQRLFRQLRFSFSTFNIVDKSNTKAYIVVNIFFYISSKLTIFFSFCAQSNLSNFKFWEFIINNFNKIIRNDNNLYKDDHL